MTDAEGFPLDKMLLDEQAYQLARQLAVKKMIAGKTGGIMNNLK